MLEISTLADPAIFQSLHFRGAAIYIGDHVAPQYPDKLSKACKTTPGKFTAWSSNGRLLVLGFEVEVPDEYFGLDEYKPKSRNLGLSWRKSRAPLRLVPDPWLPQRVVAVVAEVDIGCMQIAGAPRNNDVVQRRWQAQMKVIHGYHGGLQYDDDASN